ncbi:HNH endonuclease [Candidatus Manganitrophus noduliformans]|uniref:HNH endonuclease n=1 Tax=Candidatus Manganitrophus noduliformans TaxID=2606439 RepID=A0A7X6DSD1_9BACT|nr:HNH endonuclease signature motif containing protein [Candidatus Manganitrophus noduliformans]NKE72352.1 HNH endonuclease [Candidatus Manganitrophus noduliformans]
MVEPFYTDVDDDDIKKEKAKARELRNSQWWKRRRSTGICHYCGRKFKPSELTMDHIVPIGRGGKSAKGNVVPACKECNTRKKYMLLVEWEEYLKSVREEGANDGKNPSS